MGIPLSKHVNYNAYVKTGDKPKHEQDGEVNIVLHGDGCHSKTFKLTVRFTKDFESGQINEFKLTNADISDVESIEIWHASPSQYNAWYIDSIKLTNTKTGSETLFPVFRWMTGNKRYNIITDDTCLPQNETRKVQRLKELKEDRKAYEFYVRLPGLPISIKKIPENEEFSFSYKWDIGIQAMELFLKSKLNIVTTPEWTTVDDIKELFTGEVFKSPSDCGRWKDDLKFGQQRLNGVNNIVIRLCKAIPYNFGVTAEMVSNFLEGSTLEQALENNKIFIVDHEILENCSTRRGLTVCAPLALFYQKNCGDLMPIAIQLFQQKGKENPVFLPSDDYYTWILAKMWFNNADAQVHQASTHLGCTHLFMEGVPIITHRNLSQAHPIYKLLAPHFLYLIAINTLALSDLIEPGGFFDKTMTVGVKGANEIIVKRKNENKYMWRLNVEGNLPNDLKERGLDDPTRIPQYYFREDALDLHDAITHYVTDYIGLYYTREADLLYDHEVQNWREEMVRPCDEGGMGLCGVPGQDDKFTQTDQLISTLTSIIYTCSVQHANANFGQYDEYAFAPNYPSLLRGAPPKDKQERTMKDIMDCIGEKQTVHEIMIITKILSSYNTNPLGDFEVNYISDPRALGVLNDFKEKLSAITVNIQERNGSRQLPYTILNPENVPNAISI